MIPTPTRKQQVGNDHHEKFIFLENRSRNRAQEKKKRKKEKMEKEPKKENRVSKKKSDIEKSKNKKQTQDYNDLVSKPDKRLESEVTATDS